MSKKLLLQPILIVIIPMLLIMLSKNAAEAGWTFMNSGTTNVLEGIWGSSEIDVFAVGEEGTILHYDGNPDGIWSAMDNQST